MKLQQIEELCEKTGKSIKDFHAFMRGQTVGLNKDGSIDYYEHDVERFFNTKLTCNKKYKI